MKKSILLFCTAMMLVLSLNVAFATHIITLTATDSETDGVNGFDELLAAYGVATFTVGSTPYAIVSSYGDSSVQIINLSDPTNITAAGTATDGVNGFDELLGAYDVATFTVGSTPYAIVSSYGDDGVQIINLSDPENITAEDSMTDDVTLELDGAHGAATFTVDSTLYAIVSSSEDHGVQIINLSDPTNITPAGTATDGVNGFDKLLGAHGVATFTVDSTPYAIVSSYGDDGVQIINLSDPENITPAGTATDGVNGFDKLLGAYDVATFTVDGTPYAIVSSSGDDGVQIINLSDPTNITATDSETDGVNGFDELLGAVNVATFTVSDVPYAIVSSYNDDGVQIINLSDPTNITPAGTATDGVNGFDELLGAINVATFTVDSTPYAIVASYGDNGVQIISLSVHITDSTTTTSGGGSDNEHKSRPTFGIDEKTYAQKVTGGLVINGESFTIDDNFWTKVPMQYLNVGETQNFTAKVYAPHELSVMEFLFGISEVGKWNEAEASVTFEFDFTGELQKIYTKNLDDTIINSTSIMFSTDDVYCALDDTVKSCKQVSMEFSFKEAPIGKILALQAIDSNRRSSIVYFNDGITVDGESQNPPTTQQIISEIKYKGLQTIQRIDKENDIWVTLDSNEPVLKYQQTTFGMFIPIESRVFEHIHDETQMNMQRENSNFKNIIQYEINRATIQFDSQLIQAELGASWSYEYPLEEDRVEKIKDIINSEKIRALEMFEKSYTDNEKSGDYFAKLLQ